MSQSIRLSSRSLRICTRLRQTPSFLFVALLFLTSNLFANLGLARPVAENFRYEFHGTDVLAWQDGDGPPDGSAIFSDGAKQVLDQMEKASQSLMIAVYGVRDQDWFLTAINRLRRTLSISAVVDQKDGDLGDWRIANFFYSDTPRLASILRYRDIQPDVGSHGVPLASSIMHNKFIVFDRSHVWLGTANMSSTCLGTGYNANTSIIVESKALAHIYAAEFDQMSQGKHFSSDKERLPIDQTLTYRDGTKVTALFSPQDDVTNEGIIPLIDRCRDSIDIGMFFLTDGTIVDRLAAARRRGCEVRVILDALSARHGSSKLDQMRDADIEVRVENWGGKMHMKSAVVDRKHVIIGSMNWSIAGNEKNDENTLIVENNTSLAGEVADYFDTLWKSLDFYEDQNSPRDPVAESPFSINSCFDGMDNDYDGLVDAADPGCHFRN